MNFQRFTHRLPVPALAQANTQASAFAFFPVSWAGGLTAAPMQAQQWLYQQAWAQARALQEQSDRTARERLGRVPDLFAIMN